MVKISIKKFEKLRVENSCSALKNNSFNITRATTPRDLDTRITNSFQDGYILEMSPSKAIETTDDLSDRYLLLSRKSALKNE